jgi:chitodextrinase
MPATYPIAGVNTGTGHWSLYATLNSDSVDAGVPDASMPPTDTTAPTAPTNLMGAATSSSTITLNWNASTDNVGVTGYVVSRGGTAVAMLGNVTTYQDNGLSPSTAYSYTVTATDAAGNVSSASNPATATTQAGMPTTGKPDATNTGVTPGTTLTVVTGDQTFSTSGQVITGRDFHGFVRVTTSNVTFRDCIFRGRATSSNNGLLDSENGTNTIVQNSEFVASNPSATIDCIWAASTSIYRSNIHGCVDGVKASDNTLIQDSYIHDMSWFASDPNQGGGPTHNDGVQAWALAHTITLRHNNIDMSTTRDGNAAFQSSSTDTHVESNWLDGGGCTLNFAHQSTGGPLTGIYVVSNRFGRHSFYSCPILISTQTTLSQNTGNVWDDTGTPIPPPQQHD